MRKRREHEPQPGELAPMREMTFTITCGEYACTARDLAYLWPEHGRRRSWHVSGPGGSGYTQSAKFDWAATQPWALHHDVDVSSWNGTQECRDPSRQAELDQWIAGQRERLEAFRVECARLAGDPEVPALPPLTSLDGVGWVYLIGSRGRASELAKIGHTDGDPEERCKKLQTGSPVPLRVLARFRGFQTCERAMHLRFKHLRVRGEWFRVSDEILSAFARLRLDPSRRQP